MSGPSKATSRGVLLSMTGFGEARAQNRGLIIAVEIRSVNSRHFKLSFRCSDGYGSLESNVESIVRNCIRRGTVHLNLRIDRETSSEDYRINTEVLESYRHQLETLQKQAGKTTALDLEKLLTLPGVITEKQSVEFDPKEDWNAIEPVIRAAVDDLASMRAEEGQALASDLHHQCESIPTNLDQIALRAPLVAEGYRQRLTDRVNKVLQEFGVSIGPADLVREVSLFVERGDVSEEIVRLRSHLEQFAKTINLPESTGRKLEFITQEMGREINTIGSKSNDTEISQHVVQIKAALERIREQVQNVE